MPDVREVYEMVTKQKPPEPGALERQQTRQARVVRNRKVGAFAVAAAIGIAALVVMIQARDVGTGRQPVDQPNGRNAILTPEPMPVLPGGGVEPGRYVFSSGDPAFDASSQITIDVADGYTSVGESAVLKEGTGQTSVSTLAISDVYADPCRWQTSTLLDGAAISSADDLAATLAGQEGLRVSTPITTTVGGFPATYLERRVPAATDVSGCDVGEFHLYSSGWGDRWLDAGGQRQRLWIVDVDGMPLLIDATFQPDTSRKVQGELEQMVESIQIDPVN